MKKISRSDLQGLRCQFPVLTKEEMRRHVGGYSDSYWNGDWSSSDPYFADFGANAGSSYGYGGSGDIDGGYLPEVIINGGSGYSGGYTYSGNGYSGWGDGEDWGTGYGSYGYGSNDNQGDDSKYWGSSFAQFAKNDCFYRSIGAMLGIGSIDISDKFGDYLIKSGKSMDQVNQILAGGINGACYNEFMNFANNLGLNIDHMGRDSFVDAFNENEELKGIGLIYTGKDDKGIDKYHAITINGVEKNSNGEWELKYSDTQNSQTIWGVDHIISFYKITKK